MSVVFFLTPSFSSVIICFLPEILMKFCFNLKRKLTAPEAYQIRNKALGDNAMS